MTAKSRPKWWLPHDPDEVQRGGGGQEQGGQPALPERRHRVGGVRAQASEPSTEGGDHSDPGAMPPH
jgi:hypothetical protein